MKQIKTKTEKAKNGESSKTLRIPARLLGPIGDFLASKLKSLERRRSDLEGEDPFVSGRLESLASPDATAAEQYGHATVDALRREFDKRIIQLRKALSRVRLGQYGICEQCNQMIDTDRLIVYPEATLCVKCEIKKEK